MQAKLATPYPVPRTPYPGSGTDVPMRYRLGLGVRDSAAAIA